MFSNSALTSSSSSFHSPPSLRRGSASTPGADISSSSESSFILSKERGYGTVRTTEESVSDSGQSRRKQIWEKLRRALVVCLLVLLIVFAACAYSMVGPFLPIEASEKGSSELTTGIIIGASPLCLVIFSPFVGYYLPKLGVRFTLISGILLVGGAFFLLGFLADMPSGAVFIVFGVALRVTEGVGWAMGKTTSLALLPYFYPSNVGTLTGLLLGCEGLGFAIGPPIGSLLVSLSDYRVPFWTVGAIILLLIPLAFLVVKPTESLSTDVTSFKQILKLLSCLSFTMLLFTNIAAYSSLGFMAAALALYLQNSVGLNQVWIGIVFGILAGSYVLFAIPFGKLSDKFGTRKFIISGLILESTSLIVLGLAPSIPLPLKWTVISMLTLQGFSLSQIDIPVYSDLLKQAHSICPTTEEEKDALISTVSGIAAFSMSLGEFLGALLGGLLTTLTDFSSAVLMLGEAVTANAVLVLGVTMIDFICGRNNSNLYVLDA